METTNLTDEHRATARDLLAGASTWEASARLVGNVTAGAIAALCMAVAGNFDFAAFADDKTAWSIATFGPGKRTAGVIDHIRKELAEVEAKPDDVSEWADLIILAMDGAARSAGANGEALVAALQAKMARNKARTWPDWRTLSEDRAIEHDRSGEATAATREIDFPDEDAIAFARAAPVAAPTPEVARTVAVAALRGLIAKWRRMTDRAGYTVEAGLAEDGCANDLESLIEAALSDACANSPARPCSR